MTGAVGGILDGVGCMRLCCLSMLAMLAAPNLVSMLLVGGVCLAEWRPGPDPFATARRTRPAIAYLLIALVGSVVVA